MRILSILIASSVASVERHCCTRPTREFNHMMRRASRESCESLAKLELPNASITTANAVAAGTFVGPAQAFTGRDLSDFYKKLPAFCRIVAQARPTSDSNITVEVWMPPREVERKTSRSGKWGLCRID